jgi:hypothetical protein
LISNYYSEPTAASTQQSLEFNANVLQRTLASQDHALANSFSYDCNVFDEKNICINAGFRNAQSSAANGAQNISALIIAAFRPYPNFRIGVYADDNIAASRSNSNINLSNKTPLLGLMGVWNERIDSTGAEVKISAAYSQKNATVTRLTVGDGDGSSEPGSGTSELTSQGVQMTVGYGFALQSHLLFTPSLGLRYTSNLMGAYTEGTNPQVISPLTYSEVNTQATTVTAGIRVSYKLSSSVTAFASAGRDTDIESDNGIYSASGVSGIVPIVFNPNPARSRLTTTFGVHHHFGGNHRLALTGIYRQDIFDNSSTTAAFATYTLGF